MKRTWYFTFGCEHPLRGHVQPIEAQSYMDARYKMLTAYGHKWCAQYDAAQFAEFEAKHGALDRLPAASVTPEEAQELKDEFLKGVAS